MKFLPQNILSDINISLNTQTKLSFFKERVLIVYLRKKIFEKYSLSETDKKNLERYIQLSELTSFQVKYLKLVKYFKLTSLVLFLLMILTYSGTALTSINTSTGQMLFLVMLFLFIIIILQVIFFKVKLRNLYKKYLAIWTINSLSPQK